jgi:anti-anti-sigma regulatory factor
MESSPAIVSLAGDWDIFGRDELRRRLAAAYSVEHCILDFTGFRCGDASFLDELVALRKARKALGRSCEVFVIHEADAILHKVLQISHLAHVWPIHDSIEAALAAIERVIHEPL